MKVRDIMTSEGLATATLETTLAAIAERMRDENVGAIPIVDEDDKLAGIITDRDIVVRAIAEGKDPSGCTAEEILSEQLHTIDPDADMEEAAELMARHQIRRLPVVQEEVVIGMISLGDLAVKSEEDEASDVLEDVSEGVRHAGGSQGRRQASGKQVAEEETEYQRRGGVRHTGGKRARSQGISNRSQKEEGQRQQKVTPMRAGSRTSGRSSKGKRKAS